MQLVCALRLSRCCRSLSFFFGLSTISKSYFKSYYAGAPFQRVRVLARCKSYYAGPTCIGCLAGLLCWAGDTRPIPFIGGSRPHTPTFSDHTFLLIFSTKPTTMKLFILLTLMILTAGARLGQPRNTSTEEVFIPSAFADSNSTQSVEHRQLQSKFRLKLYWKKGYYWQESRSEKKW